MRILNIIIPILIVCILCSCKQEGPVSPEQAVDLLKKYYIESDSTGIISLLSEKNKQNIQTIISAFKTMKTPQLKALSKNFGVDINELKNLTLEKYIAIQLFLGRQSVEDKLSQIVKYDVIGINRTNDKATVRLENGMEFMFIREGAYWKYEMNE
jgi:hypothetical protein